jgi:hypothetical protein
VAAKTEAPSFTSDIVRSSFKLQPSLHIVQSRT